MAYQLCAKPNNFMTYPVISKHFRYFFQFQLQVEETYFFLKAIVVFTLRDRTCKQKYNRKVFIFCPFLLLFYLFIHFRTFSYFFQFLPLLPRLHQFPGSNELVNSNTTVKYWYSAHTCCCFISFENYNFLKKKKKKISPFYTFSNFLNFIPVSSTSSGRNLLVFLPGSPCSFWFHFPWKEHVNSNTIVTSIYIQNILLLFH